MKTAEERYEESEMRKPPKQGPHMVVISAPACWGVPSTVFRKMARQGEEGNEVNALNRQARTPQTAWQGGVLRRSSEELGATSSETRDKYPLTSLNYLSVCPLSLQSAVHIVRMHTCIHACVTRTVTVWEWAHFR